MKINSIVSRAFFASVIILLAHSYAAKSQDTKSVYDTSARSLSHYQAPEWYEDAKIGYWVHWGIYSVPAYSGDHAAEWYGRWMYSKDGQSEQNRGYATHKHHIATYGDPSKFGYKDFIPMFKAEKFDAAKWADIFYKGGAKFFTMMGVHHDNFAMWDTKLTKWNAMNMGPHRDLVGEIATAMRAKGLKFGVSNHSGWNYEFFKYNYINHYDAIYSANQDLYGNPIIDGMNAKPSERDLKRWIDRTIELSDKYKPDLYYFDWDINNPALKTRRMEFAAHYYNKGIEWNRGTFGKPGVVINYKDKAYKTGSAVLDKERETKMAIADMVWQTDDCVYAGENWGYVAGAPIKSPNTIIDELVDIVSKRGVLMLSFAPRPDGTIPEEQVKLATQIGNWLKVCGEAIYSTRPWSIFGEGPTSKGIKSNVFTADDIRFTRNKAKTIVYAIVMDWPQHYLILESLTTAKVNKEDIKSVSLVGTGQQLKWTLNEKGLTIQMPGDMPSYGYAYPVKIMFKDQIPGI
jgi:alpha-L-fucosidase